ncbi:hypothetical protein GIB67_011343 [Kingdonia uniflora]|uniref:RNase H type-1 domain-containing protein n=1 Tax=Kingdonia uniflora TaxID=39325 RepID=A0A7J7MDI8_9MAGN|nr:hypothetical protein GIB67_011343 [Kingdonia uniflora]
MDSKPVSYHTDFADHSSESVIAASNYKLFTDASWSETTHKGGMGFILTDEANSLILAGHTPTTTDSAEQAEGKYIPWAINISAEKIRRKEVLLFIDCRNVIDYLRDPLAEIQWSTATQLQTYLNS